MNNRMELLRSVLEGIVQSDEFNEIINNDPRIRASDENFLKALNAIKDRITRAEYIAISDASSSVITAYQDVAIMYGIHVAEELRKGFADPVAYGTFLLNEAKDE